MEAQGIGKREEQGRSNATGFRRLLVWQRSKELAVAVYRITREGALARDFSLRDQMQRSAVSVCSNIAEGDEREADRDSARFFLIAKGSLAELATQIEIASAIGYLDEAQASNLLDECHQIARMLGALIKVRSGGSFRRRQPPTTNL